MNGLRWIAPLCVVWGIMGLGALTAAASDASEARKRAFEAERAARPALAVAIPNTNNTCANAVAVTMGTFTGTTSFATNDGMDDCEGENDVWFSFTPTATGIYAISTRGSNFDTVLGLYSGCPGTLANLLICEDGIGTETMNQSLQAGQTYLIRLSGYEGERGNYSLSIDISSIGITSDRVHVAIDFTGNFTIGVTGGTPATTYDLLYGHPSPWSGGTTLRVDGVDYTNMNSEQLGTKLSGPTSQLDQSNLTVWQAGGVRLSQRLAITQGQSGNRDNVVMEYTVNNTDSRPHSVGMRILLDTYLGDNDGVPFRVPGLGTIQHERELFGSAIPPFWTSFESLSNPERQSQGSLMLSGTRAPDRVVWGYWGDMFDTPWDYTIDPNQSLTGDSAVAIYWNPVTLQSGQSLTVGNAYGKSTLNVNMEPPLTAALLAPEFLENEGNFYTPNPWVLNLFLEHSSQGVLAALSNVRAELILPDGLRTRSPLNVQIGQILRNASAEATWLIEADRQVLERSRAQLAEGEEPVALSYSVRILADGQPTKTLTRTIELPYLNTAAQHWTVFD